MMRCEGCGMLTTPAVFFSNEDHLPIRVAGCLHPAYETLQSENARLQSDLREYKNLAESLQQGAVTDKGVFLELSAENARLQERLAKCDEKIANQDAAAGKFVIAMRHYMITAKSAEDLCSKFDQHRQRADLAEEQLATLQAQLAEKDANARSSHLDNMMRSDLIIRLRQQLSELDAEVARLESRMDEMYQPLHDFVENMNDEEKTYYVHHPKCRGACDYGCGGIFFDHVERVDRKDEVLYSPRELMSELSLARQAGDRMRQVLINVQDYLRANGRRMPAIEEILNL